MFTLPEAGKSTIARPTWMGHWKLFNQTVGHFSLRGFLK